MRDAEFKRANHSCNGFTKKFNGQELEKGYKPDFVLHNVDDSNDFIIFELENSTSRKSFIGGLIKAAHFLKDNKRGILVFVIGNQKNTTDSNIRDHLKIYLDWISDKTNLKDIFVIYASKYFRNGVETLPILSEEFYYEAKKIQLTTSTTV